MRIRDATQRYDLHCTVDHLMPSHSIQPTLYKGMNGSAVLVPVARSGVCLPMTSRFYKMVQANNRHWAVFFPELNRYVANAFSAFFFFLQKKNMSFATRDVVMQ